ncbi:MAG: NADP oxidoreductase [Ardenticatenia bacterium]|nr:MAG: NADP oxidoreductase [Ardenticatenia bacterium]
MSTNSIRVAIIGSGPSAFYAAGHLLLQSDPEVWVDMYEHLPTPFGLVRYGVAPDHQKIKNVTKVFSKTASHPRFRFFGNVTYGKDIMLADLKRFYHAILFATGASVDRKLGIPGEDLPRSYPATEFVAWYNGHPYYAHLTFDLEQERIAVVGVGNVAVDVTRMLLKDPDELAKTDIADYALEALRKSKVREVYLLGRRGPAQAKFSYPEIRELTSLPNIDVIVPPEEAELDPLSRKELEENPDKDVEAKVELIQELAHKQPEGKPRRLILRFLVSPTELLGDEETGVQSMKLVHNELYATEAGTLRPRPTDRYEELPVTEVYRAIGYRGVPLPDVPFHERWGVILNADGRVLDPETNQPLYGLYCTGWIKRGAQGVIGTNKPDAVATSEHIIEDARAGRLFTPETIDPDVIEQFVRERQPDFVSWEDWLILDRLEVERGKAQGRPRVKFTSVEEMLEAIRREKMTAG